MKIAVTGASGFIGRNLLLNIPSSWDVFAFYNTDASFFQFLDRYQLKHIHAVACDLTCEQAVQEAARGLGTVDACVYLSANGDPALSARQPLADLQKNTLALVNFLNHVQIGRFIFFSSGAVYDGLHGDVSPETAVAPRLPYAISKLAAEHYIKFFRNQGQMREYIILRFFGAYGPFEPERKIYTRMVRAFGLEGKREYPVRGDGRNLIDAMYVDDTIEGVMRVLNGSAKDLTIDFCSGQAVTIDEIVKAAAAVFTQEEIRIIHQGAVPEYIDFRASGEAMQKHFGFKPRTPLSIGLKKLADFLQG